MADVLRSTLNPSVLCGFAGPFRHRRGAESLYRLAKQVARERGDYTATGQYHYAEQCALEDAYRHNSQYRPWRKDFRLWTARLIFGRLVFGYGERPLHPLLVGLAVILAWAAFYCATGSVVPSSPAEAAQTDFFRCLYFSVVTFTTLGYGDFQPAEGYRWLAGIEAVLGAALMATFVVCLTRKYMR